MQSDNKMPMNNIFCRHTSRRPQGEDAPPLRRLSVYRRGVWDLRGGEGRGESRGRGRGREGKGGAWVRRHYQALYFTLCWFCKVANIENDVERHDSRCFIVIALRPLGDDTGEEDWEDSAGVDARFYLSVSFLFSFLFALFFSSSLLSRSLHCFNCGIRSRFLCVKDPGSVRPEVVFFFLFSSFFYIFASAFRFSERSPQVIRH